MFAEISRKEFDWAKNPGTCLSIPRRSWGFQKKDPYPPLDTPKGWGLKTLRCPIERGLFHVRFTWTPTPWAFRLRGTEELGQSQNARFSPSRSPSARPLTNFFGWEGSPTKTDVLKKISGTLLLTSQIWSSFGVLSPKQKGAQKKRLHRWTWDCLEWSVNTWEGWFS